MKAEAEREVRRFDIIFAYFATLFVGDAWRPSALFARALVDQRHWSRGDAYRWLHRFVCELDHVRTCTRKALQVQLLIF